MNVGKQHPSPPLSTVKKFPILPLAAFFIPLLVYIATMSSELTRAHYGADSGELIAAAVTLGSPHPPGYPTYVVLGKLFSFLPIGSIATRFNIFSAVTISATAALITFIHAQSDPRKRWVNVLPALIFAFTAVVWSQAIITEVYGLNLLMVGLFLWAIHKERGGLIGLFLGLSITTHLTSLFLLPLALISIRPSQWRQFGSGLLAGLSPLLLLPLFAWGDSPIVWGDPTTFRGWIWLISGKLYHPNAFAVPLVAIYPRMSSWLREGMWQIIILFPLALVGIWQRYSPLATRYSQTRPLITLLTAVIYILYALLYRTNDAIILTLPAVLLLTTLLPRSKWLLPVPILLLLLNFNALTLHNAPSSRPQAVQILQTAPTNAILLTEGDHLIFDLWYYQQAEHIRPDLLLVDADLLAFDWYRARLGRLHPELKALAVDDLDAFERENKVYKIENPSSADYVD